MRNKILSQNTENIKSGLFISFEGIDGSGKSVQAESLQQNLKNKGFESNLLRDPGGSDISEMIRQILLDRNHYNMVPLTELLLYEAARSQLLEEKIRPALQKGHIVIIDRFTDSTIAYQGYGRSIPLDIIHEANKLVCGDTFPNLTFILNISWEESLKRRSEDSKENDRMENQKHTFFDKVQTGYKSIAKENPNRIHLLDGMQSIPELEQNILTIVLDNINEQQYNFKDEVIIK